MDGVVWLKKSRMEELEQGGWMEREKGADFIYTTVSNKKGVKCIHPCVFFMKSDVSRYDKS